MSVQRYKLIFILIFFIHTSTGNDPHAVHSRPGGRPGVSNLAPDNKARTLFSPRLEYNEWLPVGRGDPLKNDPTYDYSPPVLERVRYWSENQANKDKGNDILLLGVPSKKSSSKVEQPWSNSGPMRRNYYHHQINQLPTVLMPPPLNNHLQPDGGDGYLWAQATTHQVQRYETPAEGFRYRPVPPSPPAPPGPPAHPGHTFVNQYTGPKYTEPSVHHVTPYQQQSHPSQQYQTTIRLTTPYEQGQKKPILHTILQNEKAYPFTKTAMTSTITEYTSSFYNPQNINAMATTIIHPPQTTEYLTSEPSNSHPTVSTDIKAPFVTPAAFVAPTTTTTTTVAPPPSVTTDSLFSHYNQPASPHKGPLYLIIEGHSKVKTYGLNNNDSLMQLPKMVPVEVKEDPVIRHVVNRDEGGGTMDIPHITMKPTTGPATSSEEETSAEKSAVNSLISLLDSSFGDYLLGGDSGGNAIDSGEGDKDSKARRNARSVSNRQQLYVMQSFHVGDQHDLNPETYDHYRKGTVLDASATVNEDAFKY